MKPDIEAQVNKYKKAIEDGTTDYKIYSKLSSIYSKKANEILASLKKSGAISEEDSKEFDWLVKNSQSLILQAMTMLDEGCAIN